MGSWFFDVILLQKYVKGEIMKRFITLLLLVGCFAQLSIGQDHNTRFQRLWNEVMADFSSNEEEVEKIMSQITWLKREEGIIVICSEDWNKFHLPELERLENNLKKAQNEKEAKEVKEAINFLKTNEISYMGFKKKYLKDEN